jgi:rubrerythrin
MTSIEQLKNDGWGNCPVPSCGYFFRKSTLQLCPACKHPHAVPPSYNQPDYESPSLG